MILLLLHYLRLYANLTAMSKNRTIKGHIAAGTSTLIWGITFINTKILLLEFSPVEILFFRFLMAYIMMLILSPGPIIPKKNPGELLYMAAGLCGVTVYFLFQNIGLEYTLAANAGILISVAPMFIAIVAHFMIPEERLQKRFAFGFLLAILGISFISFNGSFILKLNPLGDAMIIIAALAWAFYSNILVIIERTQKGLPLIRHIRKIFFYGLIFMLPALLVSDFQWGFTRFQEPINLFNMLFLGLGASGLCFLTWNYAVSTLGSVKTSVYIYLIPIINLLFARLLLNEPITWISLIGTVLILAGLFASEHKKERTKKTLDIRH